MPHDYTPSFLKDVSWTILDEFSENFLTASDPPPTLISENYVALFGNKFFGMDRTPSLFPENLTLFPLKITKNATKFFGSEMTPPPSEVFRKFTEFGPTDRP